MSAASRPASIPEPPYWAVIFSNTLAADTEGYEATAARMLELAREQPGCLGVESARGEDGLGITVSYWSDRAAIAAWRAQAEHALARAQGVERWYQRYALRVARVESATGFERGDGPAP